MAHIYMNWEHLMNTARGDLIDEIKIAFKNLYRYGNESSTYKILPHLTRLYEDPSSGNFLFIMNMCESHACCQLFRNPYNKTMCENQFISWREGCKLILPKIRSSFRSYLILERYKNYMIYEATNTCKGALLLGEKKTQLRNFAWRVCMFIGIRIEPWESVVLSSRITNIRNIWDHYSDQSHYLGKGNPDKYDIDIEEFIF